MKKKKMTHFASVLGIIAIAAMIGFSLAACGDDGGGGGTTTKTVTVGAQNGTLIAGTAGTVTYPVTTANIANGTYYVTVANLPSGVILGNFGGVTISGNSGTLTLAGSTSTAEGTTDTLTLTLDGVTSGTFSITILAKTVSVGVQVGTLFAGTAGTVTYPVTTVNIADGAYFATVANLPTGVTVPVGVTINDNAGALTLAGSTSTAEGTTDTLTLTLDGVTSGTFSIVINHVHKHVYTVTSTSYPAQSIQTCACGDTIGTARNTEIGDTGPAGGIIFYIAPSGFKVEGYTGTLGTFAEYTAYYMEAAPANEGSYEWGSYATEIADVTGWPIMLYDEPKDDEERLAASIGVGRRDTQIIVNYLATTEETNRAAQVCANKTVTFGGTEFNDWFLPSLGESNEMFNNIFSSSEEYTSEIWSSSQCNDYRAWTQSSTSQFYRNKNFPRNVRAVRAF